MWEILLYFATETTPQRRKMVRTPCTKLPAVVKDGSYTLYKASRSSEKWFVHPVQSFPQ